MDIVKKRILTLILGVLFLVIALALNNLNLLRVILAITSIILLTYCLQLERNNKKVFVTLFVIVMTFFVIGLDYLTVSLFKKTPIITISIVSNEYGSVYNGIGYRVWKCNDNSIKVDPLYKIGYYCDVDYMSTESINNVLPAIMNNFEHYKNNYVKIIGRVTKIVDDTQFYMETYTESNEIITYDDKNKLSINFNYTEPKISNLNVDDIITVIGKVQNKNDNEVILVDSRFKDEVTQQGDVSLKVESNINCEYDKEYWFQAGDNNYYKSCVNSVNITIDNRNYNLSIALSNNVITLDQIKNESLGYEKQAKDNSIMYKYKDFNILVCDPSNSKDIIVGRTTMSFNDGYCSNVEENRGV